MRRWRARFKTETRRSGFDPGPKPLRERHHALRLSRGPQRAGGRQAGRAEITLIRRDLRSQRSFRIAPKVAPGGRVLAVEIQPEMPAIIRKHVEDTDGKELLFPRAGCG